MAAGNREETGRAGRSFGLILAAIAATGWGFAFYAGLGGIERDAVSRDSIAMLEERNATLADELATIRDANGRLEQVEARITQARGELGRTREERRDLEASLSALQDDIARLGRDEGAATPVSAGAANQGASPAAVNAALARLDRLIDTRSGELQAIRAARSEAESRLAAASDALEATQQSLSRDERAAGEAQETLSRLLADIERFEALIARREAQADTLADDITRAEARLAALQVEHARLRSAIEEAQSRANRPEAAAPGAAEPERLPDGTRVIRVNPGSR